MNSILCLIFYLIGSKFVTSKGDVPVDEGTYGYDCGGENIAAFEGISIFQCVQKCKDASACVGATFAPYSGTCYLKSNIDKRAVVLASPHAFVCIGVNRNGNVHENYGYACMDKDVLHFVVSTNIHECAKRCTDEKTCAGFTYAMYSGDCYIKRNLKDCYAGGPSPHAFVTRRVRADSVTPDESTPWSLAAILESPKVTDWGSWGNWDDCPQAYVTGYRTKGQPSQGSDDDDTALNGIEFTCESGDTVTSLVGNWGSWGALHSCASHGDKIIGFRLFSEPSQGAGDDTATCGFEAKCQDGTVLGTDNGVYWGSAHFTAWQECSSGTAFCGIRTQVEAKTDGDNTALNNIQVKCCQGKSNPQPLRPRPAPQPNPQPQPLPPKIILCKLSGEYCGVFSGGSCCDGLNCDTRYERCRGRTPVVPFTVQCQMKGLGCGNGVPYGCCAGLDCVPDPALSQNSLWGNCK